MKKLIFFTLLLITSLAARTQDFPTPMHPRRIVNDFTGTFTPQQTAALEKKLRNFNDTSSTQIAVVTVPSLYGYAPNDYAQQLAEKWGIGQKGKDNGILVLLKPKKNNENGQVAIAVGYGLEGVIPDAIASRIIRNEMLPAFRQNDYYTGINKATDILMQLSAGEFTADQYAKKNNNDTGRWIFLPFLVVFLVPLMLRKKRRFDSNDRHQSGGTGFPPIFFGGGGSGFGSFSSGSGSFGGFGGGSFGGGGASGSW
ncbi:YgcG family protein [Odoribacter sp. Z80]|jgi:uncharacterized protein|uniref:TPM domain-containing protein n=1 Tax=Odoribacter sp. Z80 TaxID=2304575 RepID=UPI00137B2B29|nr:TPM domain-containing protein [Odoribacter sp. Z80]NCE71950.1 TPM domain-containing protein [Odoribacter sp. Z80]